MLSVVGAASSGWYSGGLGPSTTVGSVAFNLLVIVAVCVFPIPSPEVQRVRYMAVYQVTVLVSLFAYFWLLAIAQISSPDVVTPAEAIVTLAMFPVLVAVSFAADRGYLRCLALEGPPAGSRGAAPAAFAKAPAGAHKETAGALETMSIGGLRKHSKDTAGTLEKTSMVTSGPDKRTITLGVLRRNGSAGDIKRIYHPERLSAVPGYDYTEVSPASCSSRRASWPAT